MRLQKRAMRWPIIALLSLCLATQAMAEIQFLGVMGDTKRTYFALRADEMSGTKWITVGSNVGDFSVTSYDQETEALTLRRGAEWIVLKMPASKVNMAVDDVVLGLGKILNLPKAQHMRDLIHPTLRTLFNDSDLVSAFKELLNLGTSLEIKPLTEEEKKVFESGLSQIEKAVGSRPEFGLWTKWSKGSAMSFIVKDGDSWYLAPSVPGVTGG